MTQTPKTCYMKLLTVYLSFSVFVLQNVKSQDSLKLIQVQATAPVYNVRVYLPGGQNMKVYLMAVRDSSIYIFQKQSAKPDPLHKVHPNMHDTTAWEKYDYSSIVKIKVMDKKLRTWATLGGTALGLAAGAIIISSRKQEAGFEADNSLGEDAIILILTGGAGAIAGVIVASSIEKKYQIDGNWKKFEEMKASLHY